MIICRSLECNCGERFSTWPEFAAHISGEKPRRSRRGGKLIPVAGKEQRTYRGVTYASKAEKLRAIELTLLQSDGAVLLWVYGPKLRDLGCELNAYRPDFLVWGRRSDADEWPVVWVEDVKGGYETPAFKRTRRIWRAYGPTELHVLTRRGDAWDVEIIAGGRMTRGLTDGIRAGKCRNQQRD